MSSRALRNLLSNYLFSNIALHVFYSLFHRSRQYDVYVTTKTSRWQHIVSRNFSIWWKNDRPSRRERTWTKKWKKLPSGKCQFTSLLLFIFQFYKLLLLLLTSKTTFQSKCSSCFRYAVGGDRVLLETRVPSLFPPHFFPRQLFARSPPSECLKQAKAWPTNCRRISRGDSW